MIWLVKEWCCLPSAAVSAMTEQMEKFFGRELFEQMPFNLAVIDRDFNVMTANNNFEDYFGDWKGRHCYEIYKGVYKPCSHCQALDTFRDGKVRVVDGVGIDRHGITRHYVAHLAPLYDNDGQIKYVMEMTTDLTETRRWQREYDLLFDRVPCYITVIDNDFRIIRANEKFRRTFGEDVQNRHCFEVYKKRKTICPSCPAVETFSDGSEHVSNQVGIRQDGTQTHYVVTTSPLSREKDGIAHVIEIATDITDIRELEGQLKQAHDLYESLISNSATGIIAVDSGGESKIMNPAARELLDWKARRMPSVESLLKMLPDEFGGTGLINEDSLDFLSTSILSKSNEEIPVRFRAVELKSRGKKLGKAAFLQDMRDMKRLEAEKLDAERLGAVGQTVAGLAHTIKNMLMGLEGGMYMANLGLQQGNSELILEGWEILQRNFEKTTTLVKDFLSFAKGRLPELKLVDPNDISRDIIDLYKVTARNQGVELILEPGEGIRPAFLDPSGMETCLTNLISNGIDAALMREEGGGRVTLRTYEDKDQIIFESIDNGSGMDSEIQEKVFTTFFTTKGGKGTGLGLLTTRKIIQEHGGTIEVESSPDEGSIFRIRLPRDRLETLAGNSLTRNKED
ncbi:MAG: PAS domain-containing protein [Calditrichaeota bacterium]|nr:PAS domain-containing protein [Calditrichota bacterium]